MRDTTKKDSVSKSENADVLLALPGCEAEESEVRELHGRWLDLRRKTLSIAIQLGRILTKLKAELKSATPKRNWEPYCRDHLGIEPRTARNYMRIFKEASRLDILSKLMKSETVSEIGIREALELLAEHDKAAKENPPSSRGSSNSEKTQSGSSPEGSPRPCLQLADKSLIDLKKSRWVDGLIPLHTIESWITQTNSGSDDKGKTKLESRRQRTVVKVAAEINRACGKAATEEAAELARSSLNSILTILKNFTDSQEPSRRLT